jgi:hypothetical protein
MEVISSVHEGTDFVATGAAVRRCVGQLRIHNGTISLRRAKVVVVSEATIKKFYLERLTQEDGERWFALPALF